MRGVEEESREEVLNIGGDLCIGGLCTLRAHKCRAL